ncbi:hypothetical protein [Hydrogenophaga sp. RWCD_12]
MRPAASRALIWAGVLLALAGTMVLYTRPDFLVQMADQLWSCF